MQKLSQHQNLPDSMAIPQRLRLSLLLVLLVLHHLRNNPVAADPQTNFLRCSQYKSSNPPYFNSNLNSSSSHFATAQSLQCRNYLSTPDCSACLSTAISKIRNCSTANGARVVYDGCFLRYESRVFYDEDTRDGNSGTCTNGTVGSTVGLSAVVDEMMVDLCTAVPRMEGYHAAVERETAAAERKVYGVAECWRTVSRTGCSECLKVAYRNIKDCPPNGDARAVDAGCFMRFSSTPFFGSNQTVDIAPFIKSGSSSSRKAIFIGVVVGVGGLLLLFSLLVFAWIRRSKKATDGRRGDILSATELQGPMKFQYKDLKVATRDFSDENKLGEGGFGDVYKGLLRSGKVVAVKKLAIGVSNRVQSSFLSEVKLISNVHHRNLVRLLGCSSKGPDLLLVYEYMANGSLDKFLFGERSGSLNWKQRLDIIVGMARGLAYLHDEFHVCIIHRDIKSSNILLDDEFQPKIADFGLARLLPEGQSHLTTKFAGTLGYTAPEYAIRGQLSEKADTYSYGVVALELISGRKSNDIKLEPVTQYLLEWAWKLYEEGRVLDLVDQTLDASQYAPEDMRKVIEIALLCTQSAVARPTMSEVVVMLLSRGRPEIQPTRPTFIDKTSRIRGDTSSSSGSTASNATVSVSQFSAR